MSGNPHWQPMDPQNPQDQQQQQLLQQQKQNAAMRLNVNAQTFSYNPAASSFNPGYGGPPNSGPGYYPPQGQYGYPQQYGGYGGYQGQQYAGYGGYGGQYGNQGYQSNQGYQQNTPSGNDGLQPRATQQVVKNSSPSVVAGATAPVSRPAGVGQPGQQNSGPPAKARVVVLSEKPKVENTAAVSKEEKIVKEIKKAPSEARIEPTAEEKVDGKAADSDPSNLNEDWEEKEDKPSAVKNDVIEPSEPEKEVVEKIAKLEVKEAADEEPAAGGKKKLEEPAPAAVEVEEEAFEYEDSDPRDHMNAVFIGHVDAGKSTIGGQILYLSGMVDKRTIEKFEREAKEKNRDSWYMAYIMDTNEEERSKGITVEVGRAHFETEKRRYTVLDAPGHKNYVPNMISGASQADVGVLVISARKGEFETGYERGGQTREHAQLAKTLGVSKLVVVVNKMDEPSVQWSKERFDEIVTKMTPFLKQCGYNTKKDVQFLPISGLMGHNMKVKMDKSVCPWWEGSTFFDTLDALELPERDPRGSFRMPLIDRYRDMGTVVMGKVESGSVRRGQSLLLMPNRTAVRVVTIFRDNDEVPAARPGENLRVRLSGVEEEDVSQGFVLCSKNNPITAVTEFDAQLQILELLDHKAIFTAGYKAVLHIHSVVEECEIIQLLKQMDPKTKQWMKKKPLFVKSNAIVMVRLQVAQVICAEKFADYPQLGRFTLRDEGKTIAIGKVMKLISQK